jgi:hypothetical protein
MRRNAGSGIVTLVGHPFASTGRGEDLRGLFRALKSAGVSPNVVDLFDSRRRSRNRGHERELRPALVDGTEESAVRIFFLETDEIGAARRALAARRAASCLDVVCPAWELARVPAAWGELLDGFDEIWVPSTFAADAVRPVATRPVTVVPWPVEPSVDVVKGRRSFGIQESAFVFLSLVDLRSRHALSDPGVIAETMARFVLEKESANSLLVLRVLASAEDRSNVDRLRDDLGHLGHQVVFLADDLPDGDDMNLVRCCDAFVSLHRSTSFGRPLAEAMFFGKPVIGTGYSGNLEFMTARNSCLVGHRLADVPVGASPYWMGQTWAEPDVGEAVEWMKRLAANDDLREAVGKAARRTVETSLSYLACGLRMTARLEEVGATASSSVLRQAAREGQPGRMSRARRGSRLDHVAKRHDTAVILHVFYPELWPEICSYLSAFGGDFDLFVTMPVGVPLPEERILGSFPDAFIYRCDNRGRDIAPFLAVLSAILPLRYRHLCKLHTKRSTHRQDGDRWRQDMLEKLIGSAGLIALARRAFDENALLGILAPQGHVVPSAFYWGSNAGNVARLAEWAGIPFDDHPFSFAAGSMFWFRPEALSGVAKMNVSASDFEVEEGQTDGTLAHAFERFFGLFALRGGFQLAEFSADGATVVFTPAATATYAHARPTDKLGRTRG